MGSPLCSCGQVEDLYHFLFSYTLYNQESNHLFNELLKIDQIYIIDNYCLLLGKEILPESRNTKKKLALVQNYVRDSSRFNLYVNIIYLFFFLFLYELGCNLNKH